MGFPLQRNRRLRASAGIRDLVSENHLTPHDFIAPLFITEGKLVQEPITGMPDQYRRTLDLTIKEVQQLWSLGVRSVLLFVKVPDDKKDSKGSEALNADGLMQRSIKAIKDAVPDMVVMTDVALDPFSADGHDGLVANGIILNDETNEVLAAMAVSHAEAGADIIAPSDMMDGRVLAIRTALESVGYLNTGIMSYSAKYASALYGPFRNALDSAPGFGDKKTYQMDSANGDEAIREVLNDIEEGADIVMVKPGTLYLDVIKNVKSKVNIPVAAYNVSGEYAMIKAAAAQGWLDHDAAMMENLIAFKRAGADLIATYFVNDACKILNK